MRLASIKAKPSDKEPLVSKLLSKPSALDFSKSIFLKFLFNRLEKSRRALYKLNHEEKFGINSVVHESIRTIRTLYTEPDKNEALRKYVNKAFTVALVNI